LVALPFSKNNTTVFTPAPVKVPPGKSKTVCRLQFSNNCLRNAYRGIIGIAQKSIFNYHTSFTTLLLVFLIKCCKNKDAVSPFL
jgi:hypothetical protein